MTCMGVSGSGARTGTALILAGMSSIRKGLPRGRPLFRGGSWGCEPEECRSASRDFNPEGETGYVGFRVVLAPGQP